MVIAQEIERKYLVTGMVCLRGVSGTPLRQGYMYTAKGVVRVRVAGDKAYLTIKSGGLIRRMEYEYAIPVPDADVLLEQMCQPYILEKTRYDIPHGGHIISVDQFHGVNDGLVVAEIELQSEDEAIELPEWIGEEVSLDGRYHNSNLVKHPFCDWGD